MAGIHLRFRNESGELQLEKKARRARAICLRIVAQEPF